jgi:diguanylate cyclase
MSKAKVERTITDLQSLAEINSIEEASLAFLRNKELPVTPENYAVAYGYFSPQENFELKQQISQSLEQNIAFSQEFCSEMHARYLSTLYEMKVMKAASNALQLELDSILKNLQLAGEDTGRFGERMEGYSKDLLKADFVKPQNQESPSVAIKPLIEKLVSETRHMEKKSRDLEKKLNSSSHEINQLKKNLELVRMESMTDPLTQVGNRKYFEESFNEIIAQQPPVFPISLIIGDIDHFKRFNDSWGHQMGDQVLKIVAQCLKSQLKDRGKLARYGGEEFVVILPGIGIEAGCTLADDIRKVICRQKMKKKATGETIGQITVSFGVAGLRTGESLVELVRRADRALYEAKSRGRNMVVAESGFKGQLIVGR